MVWQNTTADNRAPAPSSLIATPVWACFKTPARAYSRLRGGHACISARFGQILHRLVKKPEHQEADLLPEPCSGPLTSDGDGASIQHGSACHHLWTDQFQTGNLVCFMMRSFADASQRWDAVHSQTSEKRWCLVRCRATRKEIYTCHIQDSTGSASVEGEKKSQRIANDVWEKNCSENIMQRFSEKICLWMICRNRVGAFSNMMLPWILGFQAQSNSNDAGIRRRNTLQRWPTGPKDASLKW